MLEETRKLLDRLALTPLLLKQHQGLPSVVSIVSGEDLKHSWWSHPKSHLLFRVMNELTDHPDVLLCKLLFRKDTFVHRQLFRALLALIEADEGAALSLAARQLWRRVLASEEPLTASGATAKELALKLKVHAFQVHTANGRHEVRLESWQCWAKRAGVTPLNSLPTARLELVSAVAKLGATSAALPFHRRS